MKQEDLHVIGVEQELIDKLFLFKKQIKELKKIIDSSQKEISKYKKEKPKKKDCQLPNGTISFLKYKKINLISELIILYQSDCAMAEYNLAYRLDWIKDFQEYIYELNSQKNLREEKISSLSKLF